MSVPVFCIRICICITFLNKKCPIPIPIMTQEQSLVSEVKSDEIVSHMSIAAFKGTNKSSECNYYYLLYLHPCGIISPTLYSSHWKDPIHRSSYHLIPADTWPVKCAMSLQELLAASLILVPRGLSLVNDCAKFCLSSKTLPPSMRDLRSVCHCWPWLS